LNAVIYDGVIRKGDIIVVGGKEKPIVTKVRAVFLPKPLDEIRDPRDKFSSVDTVSAAAGIKIVAPNLENSLAGAPIYAVSSMDKLEEYVQYVSEEVMKIKIETDMDGIVLKTDALGSLEAITESLKENNIPIRLADVGDVSKRDITEASVVKEHEPLYGAILAFNVKILPDAEEEATNRKIPIFRHNIIYHLIDDYTKWLKTEQEASLQKQLDLLIKPGKIRVLPGYVFRRAKPAIVGVEVLVGQIKSKYVLINEDGEEIGEILQIQDKGQVVSEAKTGMEVAISLDKAIVGRHVFEKDTLYVKVPENHAKTLLTKFQNHLSSEDLNALNEFVELMRRKTPFWAA
jgi:translation initiation factor 5B